MGNCFFGANSDPDASIKVITSNGGIMEFSAPVTVYFITNEFPGQGMFKSHDLFWKPLSQYDELIPGQSYYLLPLNNNNNNDVPCDNVVRHGHIRSLSVPMNICPAPYRMSLDYQHQQFSSKSNGSNKSNRCSNKGKGGSSRFWKVKLVITPEQLLEILAQEARTKELIENVRIVAKCGVGGGGSGISSVAAGIVSDQWSTLSSTNWSFSSKIDDALAVGI